MTPASGRLVALVLRCYPKTFRNRFEDDMIATFHDHLDAVSAQPQGSRMARMRLVFLTIAGLVRALVPTYIAERRRAALVPHHQRQRTTRMQNVLTDARYVFRSMRKQPTFAAVAVLTLALGIGANTAVFSVLNSVILAPLPYDQPDDLVRLYTAYRGEPNQTGFSTGPDIVAIRDEVDAFSSVGVMYTYREIGLDLTTDGPPQRIRVLRVSAEYFQTYRATPLLGRGFTRDEERHGVPRVVLSHHLWDAQTGRDPDVVGKSLDLDGVAFEVIGVMRPTFMDVVAGDVDGWIPQNLEIGSSGNGRNNHYLSAVARLSAGKSIEQAQAQVSTVMSQLEAEFPDANEDRIMRVEPLHRDVVGESTAAVYVLMGAAGLVLLIACLNVANLFLARSVAQTRETAIRSALGAGRSRVMGHRFTESVLVATVGGLVGSVIAYWGVKVLLAISPESLARAEAMGFNGALLAFAVFVTVVTGLIFGAAPAYRAARIDPNDALHDGSRGNTGGKGSHRARSILVATQVSVALVLLVGAGILIKSFAALQSLDLGFEPARVATFEVHLPAARYGDAEQRVEFHHQFMDRLAALPGVSHVSATSWLPANGHYHQWGYGHTNDAGEYQWLPAMARVVDGDYFAALEIPLIAGRAFTRLDRADTEPVAIINESLARLAHGDADPLGRTFSLNGDDFTIIGVVGDVAYEANGTGFAKMYVSHGQFADNRNWAMTYAVKTDITPTKLIAPARQELAAIDPALVLYQPGSMESVIGRHRARDRFTLLLMVVFAGVALTLAAVGVYGVLSYAVSQRTHEIGVRMALGARPGQVRATVMSHGFLVAGIGMLVGLAGALALSRLLGSLVFDVSTADPTVFASVALLLGGVILTAGFIPARRATRVDPLDALRSE